jgi:hypothetical protein
MDRAALLGRIQTAWETLEKSYAGLSDAQLTELAVSGDWSVKEILAHVTTWEEESLKYLPVIIEGGRPPRYARFGGIDAFNATMTAQKRGLSLADVRQQMGDVHGKLIDFLQGVPEGQFTRETRFRRRLRLDTYRHYLEHARAIRDWRAGRSVE